MGLQQPKTDCYRCPLGRLRSYDSSFHRHLLSLAINSQLTGAPVIRGIAVSAASFLRSVFRGYLVSNAHTNELLQGNAVNKIVKVKGFSPIN